MEEKNPFKELFGSLHFSKPAEISIPEARKELTGKSKLK